MPVVLKDRLTGYYYINASKADKQVYVYFQFTETEAYFYSFVFPKCNVSYVFFFRDPETQELFISTKAANNLEDAMDQPNFSLREPMILIVINDVTKKSINFGSVDETDQTFDSVLFDPNCTPTEAERIAELAVRQSVLDGNAGTNFNIWLVDDLAVELQNPTIQALIKELIASDTAFSAIVQTVAAQLNANPAEVSSLIAQQINAAASSPPTNPNNASPTMLNQLVSPS